MEAITITLVITPSEKAKNIDEIKLNVDGPEQITYQKIISALMAVTENLIEAHNKAKENEKQFEKDLQLE